MNVLIISLYVLALIIFGLIGRARSASNEEFRVAGRRLGGFLYTGTLCALVLGGASTIGGVSLGYTRGISGMWLVVSIALGVILLSLFFAPIITKFKLYTVSQVLSARYGSKITTRVSSIVMLTYTIMIAVTSTTAYASIFRVLFGLENQWSILIGATVVILYSMLGGMWAITLTDMFQFAFMTVGMFFLLLPVSLASAGGWSGLTSRLDAEFFNPGSIGLPSLLTMFVLYTLGQLSGQVIWQRVFTARTPKIARWGGAIAGLYVAAYGVAGAVIGMSARVLEPNLAKPDDAFATLAQNYLPAGLGGVVLAAGVAAMMSTASGTLIAASTIMRVDIVPMITGKPAPGRNEGTVTADRVYLVILGVLATVLAMYMTDTVTALRTAYNILIGGLLVSILGALVWKRATGVGAILSMIAGTTGVLIGIASFGVTSDKPIYIGLGCALVFYVAGSLLSKPTAPEIMQGWTARLEESADSQGSGKPAGAVSSLEQKGSPAESGGSAR